MNANENEQPEPGPQDEQTPDSASTDSLLAAAEERAEQLRTDFLRAIAELENFRKRSAREVDSARQFGVERLAGDLLPVADTLGLAVESAGTADAATLAQGQEATLRLLLKALERAGLSEIDPAGATLRPFTARGDGDAALRGACAAHRAPGRAERLAPERPAAATRPGDRFGRIGRAPRPRPAVETPPG